MTARRRLLGRDHQWGCGLRRTPATLVALASVSIAAGAGGSPAAADAPQSQVLMLWGGVTPDGQLRLDPAFIMDAPEKLPSVPGPYRLEVAGDGGDTLFTLDFAMDEISDGSGGFLFMAPFREEWRGGLDRIVLTGPAGTATLDRGTHRPTVIVIDNASGQIRAILRGAGAEARIEAVEEKGTDADSAGGTRLLVSYGLPRAVPNQVSTVRY